MNCDQQVAIHALGGTTVQPDITACIELCAARSDCNGITWLEFQHFCVLASDFVSGTASSFSGYSWAMRLGQWIWSNLIGFDLTIDLIAKSICLADTVLLIGVRSSTFNDEDRKGYNAELFPTYQD
jgi:hypothetical protein